MEIKVSYSESIELLKTISHSSCRNAIENNWLINDAGKINKIFGGMSFQNFDTHVEHEWARWARYQYTNADIEKQLRVCL